MGIPACIIIFLNFNRLQRGVHLNVDGIYNSIFFCVCVSSSYMWRDILENDHGNVSSVESLFCIKTHGSVILEDIKESVHSSVISVHEDSQNNGHLKNICAYIQARNHTPVICVGKLLLIVQTSPSIKRQVFICNIIQFNMFVNLWKTVVYALKNLFTWLSSDFHGIFTYTYNHSNLTCLYAASCIF